MSDVFKGIHLTWLNVVMFIKNINVGPKIKRSVSKIKERKPSFF